MCGIIAYTGSQQVLPVLMDGLRRLEYRGYDSAGISFHSRKRIRSYKAAGKISVLESRLPESVSAQCGIGHTRWATHGAPTDENSHPHSDESEIISVVHNGIIENVDALRDKLGDIEYRSETDSEVLAHLLARSMAANKCSLIDAMREVLGRIVGTYGIAAISAKEPASDMSALSRYTREVVHLDDGEVAELTPDGFEVTLMDASPADKSSITLAKNLEDYDRGGYDHYLYREIVDQPDTVRRALSGRLDKRFSTVHLGGLNMDARDLLQVQRIKILGCGSALYAGMSGANMIEQLSRIPCDAEPAAEFRYRNPVIEANTLYIVVSQSGETFDTLAATREIQRKGGFVLGIVNSVGSTIAREVDGGIYMHAGPEVSVASTKAFTAMLSVFALLAIMFGRSRDVSPQRGAQLLEALEEAPERIADVLALETHIADIAKEYARCHSAFFIGRTSALKHGPLALVCGDTPCVVILPETELLEKSLGALEEIKARGAPVIAVTDSNNKRIGKLADHVISTPRVDELVQGMIMGVALQIYSYHSAVALGRDVDQPRNLAKSVTVE